MLRRIKSFFERVNDKLVYEDMMCCFYCKYWGVVNWCNLKNERTYPGWACDEWEVME